MRLATSGHSLFVTRHSSFANRGFSFTELLFAVMILGIGFILVAAIFPVGLAQTKSNFDETHTAALARSGAAEVGRVAYDTDFTSGILTPLQTLNNNTSATSRIAHANMISPSDPRYAWVGLYRKVSGSDKTAQLCMVLVNRSQPFIGTISGANNDSFDIADSVRPLEPRRVSVDIENGVATISAPANPIPQGGEASNAEAAAPGTFVVIAIDNLANNSDITDSQDRAAANGRLNGRMYRLGAQTATNTFEMFPGSDFVAETFSYDHDGDPGTADRVVTIPSIRNATAYIVGRNRINSTGNANQDFEGTTMDVAYYTTFISLK